MKVSYDSVNAYNYMLHSFGLLTSKCLEEIKERKGHFELKWPYPCKKEHK